MTRALVTQLVEALEYAFTGNRRPEILGAAIKAAREYLETEPKPTLKEALTQQGIKLRTEFEPKQRDHIEDSLGMVGERAELIARLFECLRIKTLTTREATAIKDAADMLEADAQQAKRVPMTNKEIDEIGVDYSGNFQVLRDFARAIEAHHGITPAEKPTGWDNGLSQDYCAEFGKWLASRPGARQQIKEMFDEPEDLYALALKADNWGQP